MKITNAQFKEDNLFTEACTCADIPPTTRQASKYRRGLGLAVRFKQRASTIVNQKRIQKEKL